jgi:Hint domain
MAGRTISSTYTTGITLTSTAVNPVSVTGRISVTSGVALTGQSGATNSWTIDNAGTIITTAVSTGVFLGAYESAVASGTLINESGGVISSGGYGVFINGAGSVTNKAGGTIVGTDSKAVYISGSPGTIVNGGVLRGGNVAAYEYDGGSITNLSGGTITGAGGVWFQQPGTFTNAGVVIGTNAGFGSVLFNSTTAPNRLIVDPGASFTGNIQSLSGGTNVVELASAASAGTLSGFNGTSITNFTSLQFDSGAQWTVTGNSLANGLGTIAISGFTINDTIDLTGFVATSETYVSNALVLTNASNSHATLHIQGGFTTADFQVNDTTTDSIITATCYAAGTRILTPRGEIAVEHLREGDLVRTVSGRQQPIRWVGHRHVDFRHHPNRQRILPVRVAAHAFGPGMPKRALLLSPDHAVFVEDVLIPIRHLVNGTTVAQVERTAITYHHIEMPHHDVLLAEGMPAESYLEAGARNAFVDGAAVIQLHADFAPARDHYAMLWETEGYAPLVVAGAQLERTREKLARQARLLSPLLSPELRRLASPAANATA